MACAEGSHVDALDLCSAAGPGSGGCLSGAGVLGAVASVAHAAGRALRAAAPELRLHPPGKVAQDTRDSLCYRPC